MSSDAEERSTAVIGWVLYVLALAMFAGSGLFSYWTGDALPRTSTLFEDLLWSCSWLGFGLVGAIIVMRRQRNLIGWLLCGITFGVYLSLFVGSYAMYAALAAEDAPLVAASIWVSKWIYVPVIAQVVALVILFPTGSAEGRWRRDLLTTVLALFGVETMLVAFEPLPIGDDPRLMNPLGIETVFMESAPVVVGFVLVALALAAVVDAVVRARRSHGVRRKQFRWFSLAVVLFPMLFALALVIQATPLWQEGDFDTVLVAFVVGLNAVAVAIGIAVTRYRLFDIDRAMSRTVSYALLTAVLVTVYAGSVLGIGLVLRQMGARDSDLVVAVSTLLSAALFQPARRRIQTIVDLRFNRQRYDGLRAAGAFGNRLRDEVDLDVLALELRQVVTSTVQPSSVTLWTTQEPVG